MGLLEALIGVIAIGWIGSLFGGSSDDSSDYSSDAPSKGYQNLHNEADRNHGIALNNYEPKW